jgi:membrane-anchored glycerophosphoryl diester phosphodiesterase (GDPDase)
MEFRAAIYMSFKKTQCSLSFIVINVIIINTTCCIITGLFISLKKRCENVSEKERIFADEGATVRALLKNKNAEK